MTSRHLYHSTDCFFAFNVVVFKLIYGELKRYTWFILTVLERKLCNDIRFLLITLKSFPIFCISKNAAVISFIHMSLCKSISISQELIFRSGIAG